MLEQQKFLERGCLSVVSVIAALELLAWLMPPLAAHLPDIWRSMGVNAPAGMLMAVSSIVLTAPGCSSRQQLAGRALTGLLTALALATLLEYSLERSLGIDALLARSAASPDDIRMSSETAYGFLLLGPLIAFVRSREGVSSLLADILTSVLAAYVLALLAERIFGITHLYGELQQKSISPQSLLCLVLLVLTILSLRTVGGMFSILSGSGIGSRIARIALPIAALLPMTLSLLRGYLSYAGLLSNINAAALSMVIVCFSAFGLILLMSWHINTLERRLREALDEKSRHELQESEQRYSDLVEQAVFGIIVRTQNHRIVLVNDAYCRMSGYTRDELMQLPVDALLRDEDRGVLARNETLCPGQSRRIETRLRRKDGSGIPIEAITQRLMNGNLQSTLEDLSERQRAEQSRQESERRYAELVEQALEGILLRNQSGEFLFVNEALSKMLGYTRDALLRMTIRDLVHPADAETILQIERLRAGEALHLEKRMLRKDGQVLYVEVSSRRLPNGDIQTTVHDLTESRRAEQARRESEQRYADLVEQAADSIWVRSVDGRMVFVNDAACQLLGYTREELLASKSGDLLHPSDPGTYDRVDGLKPQETLRIERLLRHKDGHPIPVEASVRRLANGETQVISHDITERKQVEVREHAYVEDLRRLSQRLLEAQETERRSIATELHDEVGQALTAAQLKLRDLEQRAPKGVTAREVGEVSSIVAELLKQVRQMSLDLRPSVLDDLGLVSAMRWFVRERILPSGIDVTLKLPVDLPRLSLTLETTFFRVFQAALTNALRHADAKRMTVTLELKEQRLKMLVGDNGRGFDMAAARRSAVGGKSLGLLGMEERVHLAGGEITIDSMPGRGTEVRIDLPYVERPYDGREDTSLAKEG